MLMTEPIDPPPTPLRVAWDAATPAERGEIAQLVLDLPGDDPLRDFVRGRPAPEAGPWPPIPVRQRRQRHRTMGMVRQE
jgi:hypothetical protein